MEVLDPEFEIMFIKYYQKIVGDSIDFEKIRYSTILKIILVHCWIY